LKSEWLFSLSLFDAKNFSGIEKQSPSEKQNINNNSNIEPHDDDEDKEEMDEEKGEGETVQEDTTIVHEKEEAEDVEPIEFGLTWKQKLKRTFDKCFKRRKIYHAR
jgi:hypothetical protein